MRIETIAGNQICFKWGDDGTLVIEEEIDGQGRGYALDPREIDRFIDFLLDARPVRV